MKLASTQLRALGVEYSEVDLARHFELSKPKLISPDRAFLNWAESWLLRLGTANRERGLYPEPAFQQALGEYWWKLCREARGMGLSRWRIFSRSPLAIPALRDRAGWLVFSLSAACRVRGRRGQAQS